jgi:hypothetical protein
MVLKSKHLQTSQINLSTPERLNDMLLHKTYIEAKTKKHFQQPNALWDSLQHSEALKHNPIKIHSQTSKQLKDREKLSEVKLQQPGEWNWT